MCDTARSGALAECCLALIGASQPANPSANVNVHFLLNFSLPSPLHWALAKLVWSGGGSGSSLDSSESLRFGSVRWLSFRIRASSIADKLLIWRFYSRQCSRLSLSHSLLYARSHTHTLGISSVKTDPQLRPSSASSASTSPQQSNTEQTVAWCACLREQTRQFHLSLWRPGSFIMCVEARAHSKVRRGRRWRRRLAATQIAMIQHPSPAAIAMSVSAAKTLDALQDSGGGGQICHYNLSGFHRRCCQFGCPIVGLGMGRRWALTAGRPS